MDNVLMHQITEECEKDTRDIFAYLYGSALTSEKYRDVEIAVYVEKLANPFELTADLKEALYQKTAINADVFDVRVINEIPSKGDVFSLLYLKNIFSSGKLLVDNNPVVRANFIEQYSAKYRECEGLVVEVLR